QSAETVGIDQAEIDQLAQRILDLRPQQAGLGHDFVEERGTMRFQRIEHGLRPWTGLEVGLVLADEGHPQRCGTALHDRDRRSAYWRSDPVSFLAVLILAAIGRRQPRPGEASGET